jgi:GMP synthase (glutamine-hydrolysing)
LRSVEPESGDLEVDVVKQDPIFDGIPATFTVKQMHNDSVTLPENFELLATSKTCKVQLMKHKQNPLYTCQFHPEFYNTRLIHNFLQLCGKP